ncbi:hypothetical protein C9439_00480 [archaeon SCG-AAA382B04]|nr:hypothetical protein C9439_00480 [archaeon SCG-AAA382B04]
MQVIVCSCDNSSLDAKHIRLFLNSKEEIDELKIFKELCESDDKEKQMESQKRQEKTLIAACPKLTDFKKNKGPSTQLLDLKNLVYSVNPEEKTTDKVKKLLEEKINELDRKKIFYREKETDKANILSMEPSLGEEKDTFLKINRDKCPSTEEWSCSYCKDSCPTDSFNDKKMAVDKRKCTLCGICSNSCFLDLLEKDPKKDLTTSIETVFGQKNPEKKPKLNRAKKKSIDAPILAFACSQKPKKVLRYMGKKSLTYPSEIIPIFIPCLSEINTKNILDVFLKGGEGVLLIGCENCFNESKKYTKKLLKTFQGSFKDTLLQDRVKLIKTNGRDSKEINKEIKDFSSNLDSKEKVDIALFTDNIKKDIEKEPLEKYDTTKRKTLIKYLKKISSTLDVRKTKLKNLTPLFAPKIDLNQCNSCEKCFKECSTDALQKKEDILVIQEWKCVGCNKCVENCTEEAIEIKKETPSIENIYLPLN